MLAIRISYLTHFMGAENNQEECSIQTLFLQLYLTREVAWEQMCRDVGLTAKCSGLEFISL